MIRLLLLPACLFFTVIVMANTIVVKNIDELSTANKNAKPGDIIVLQNGEWNNVTISLNCSGTKEQPIIFKAQTAGKVLVTGNSKLKLGGHFITVDGLYFINGYAGSDPVINFRVDKNQLANNCRVTNCAISDFNNPKRMDENNWVVFYGKNNQLDHCSFADKKNMGVLLAVILDDDRSRLNFHTIEYNYFGKRIPLASNGGEIIRVGVAQHCQFSSSTIIKKNFFDQCDGETEIISIKSGHNLVQENIFKESQGSVVLRHGDSNMVVANYFIGNDKPGTGGVRVINKGQQVSANVFYKCRGADFRAPMAVMNGIPNSPAIRYVQVTDAQVVSNIFYECAPLSFCEGSDTERTLPPDKVDFAGNVFYNSRDSIIYRTSDDIGGFRFANNSVSQKVRQSLPNGFNKTSVATAKAHADAWYVHVNKLPSVEKTAYATTGANWYPKKATAKLIKPLPVNCKNAEEVYQQLKRKEPVIIQLTGKEYVLSAAFIISKPVQFTGNKNVPVSFTTENLLSAFIIAGNGNLSLQNLNINGAGVKAKNFISNDSSGSADHYNLSVKNCTIQNLDSKNGCENFYYACKYMIADSIIFRNNSFLNNNSNTVMMANERDNKGYYSAEKITVTENDFNKQNGTLINIYRGGNDESTMGPLFTFSNNTIRSSGSEIAGRSLISLYGVQHSFIEKNNFTDCNKGSVLIHFEDAVRAAHLFRHNTIKGSGGIITDKYVQPVNNSIQ
ncbi:MAG: polysaccharide lyase 6 family protein [Bacteroidota bacterium]